MPAMRPSRPIGILGYGAYIPRYRLQASEVARVWHGGQDNVPIAQKAVAGPDEDAITMAVEAARNALARAGIAGERLQAVWVGSESHPYAVKPSSTIVAEALGAGPLALAADVEFACKAGSEALQMAVALVGSGMADCALAIGADTAQGRPADELEYTAGSGAAAFVVGLADEAVALLEGSVSYVSDTPDFFRRGQEHYPRHGGRFTGEPAYFAHVLAAGRELLSSLGRSPADYAYVVLHQPNPKFPARAAAELGFRPEQWQPGLLVDRIGNTYAASSLLGLTAVLDRAEPGERVFFVSFGSGAGSDALSLVVTEKLPLRRHQAPATASYIARQQLLDYATYARFRGKIAL